MKCQFFLIGFICFRFFFAQNLDQVHKDLHFLTSKKCWGRGYTKDGMSKSANYIKKRLRKLGVLPFDDSNFSQELFFNVNSFPGKMTIKLNGNRLRPGIDYVIGNESCSVKGEFSLKRKDSLTWLGINQKGETKLVLRREKKLIWSVGTRQEKLAAVQVLEKLILTETDLIYVDIEANEIKNFRAENVLGYVKGASQPDSFLVFSAHYDHLGGMGKEVFFPGANDNASGVCMLLQLAEYFKKNPPFNSVAFIFFCGEEAGLLGSKHYVENPVFPIGKIKFLNNLDLLGTGDEGITVVNGSLFRSNFEALKDINFKNQFLPNIYARGKAANSDHYWFTERGVPSFFIYTLGGIKAYHDIYDIHSTLPLTKFSELFKLLIYFENTL